MPRGKKVRVTTGAESFGGSYSGIEWRRVAAGTAGGWRSFYGDCG